MKVEFIPLSKLYATSRNYVAYSALNDKSIENLNAINNALYKTIKFFKELGLYFHDNYLNIEDDVYCGIINVKNEDASEISSINAFITKFKEFYVGEVLENWENEIKEG